MASRPGHAHAAVAYRSKDLPSCSVPLKENSKESLGTLSGCSVSELSKDLSRIYAKSSQTVFVHALNPGISLGIPILIPRRSEVEQQRRSRRSEGYNLYTSCKATKPNSNNENRR
ncbi:hypothetical protein KFK09_010670 [Dendrobium nobile]|uniref:Uncharacterized protein n=1 Tax=Dendrobium nobile TaxID=94219 RepID=A0A8T3BCR7_DENNO|nr:hypothetical protein KFK09_010670 [Dendrobium nobile]